MASCVSLEVQRAIHCATEPHRVLPFWLVRVRRIEVACSGSRKQRSLSLCTNGMQFEKQRHYQGLLSKKEPTKQSHQLKGTAGILTQDLLFTRQALRPAKPWHPTALPRASILWYQLRDSSQMKSHAALLLCTSSLWKARPQNTRWCLTTSKGTAGIRTQDLLFTRQAL